jgi:hypothetical protein
MLAPELVFALPEGGAGHAPWGAVRSRSETEDGWPFPFKLELHDGTPADPPTMRSAVPNMHGLPLAVVQGCEWPR